jgi:hypothetical protein
MPVIEIGHRIVEQVKRRSDRLRPSDWANWGGFDGPVLGLPGLGFDSIPYSFVVNAQAIAARARSGAFHLLGQEWPAGRTQWWRSDLWTVDPQTGRHWPGAGRFAFSFDYRDGGSGDPKFVWELNRLQFLPAIAIDATARGDSPAAGELLDIVEGWMEANPPYQGINWTSGIELATRIVSLLAALAFLRPGAVSATALARFTAFIEAHAYWIDRYPSLHSSANNHRVAELGGLFLAGLCAPSLPDARRYSTESHAGLEREIARQFHPDGVGVEQSPTYAAYSLEWFAIAGIAGQIREQPFSDGYRHAAAHAATALRWMMDEGGYTPRIGDDDEGRVLALDQASEQRYVASVVALVERWLGRPQPTSEARDPALRDALLPGGMFETGPIVGVRTFLEGGYTVWRIQGGACLALLVFDHGALGMAPLAAHGHADALSIWLHLGDEAVIVDPGTFRYQGGGVIRDRLRGTSAHNTVSVGGSDQSRIAGTFAWSRQASVRLIHADDSIAVAEHDGYLSGFGVVHRRSVSRIDEGFMIEDIIEALPTADDASWLMGLLAAPGVSVSLNGKRATLITKRGRSLEISLEGPAAGQQWTLAQAEHSPGFNRIGTTSRLVTSGAILPGRAVASRMRVKLGEA